MSESKQDFKQRKEHAFDAYCKKVLRNEARDHQRMLERRRKKEVLFCELSTLDIAELSVLDNYFSNHHLFYVLDAVVSVDDIELGWALKELEEKKRTIVLLSYFFRLSDRRIAEVMGMKRATVQYHRTLALKELRELLEAPPF